MTARNSAALAARIGDVPRTAMPQIATARQAEFLSWLAAAGVAVGQTTVAASALAKTQTEIDATKVARLADATDAVKAKSVLVSVDGYILDGHHHWAYHALAGDAVAVTVVGLEMSKLLTVALDWVEAA